jgi:phosphatidylglycerol---prolipoprotein diacylglyceryl transferase
LLYGGFVVGVVCGAYVSRLDYPRFAVSATILLLFGLIGARIWYVIGHLQFFTDRTDPMRGKKVGAGLYGAFVLSFAASWPVTRLTGLDFWRFADGGTIVLLVEMVVTRFGCLMNGCCCGRETHGPFGLWLPNDRDEWKRRYPTQLFEAGWSAIILGVALHRPSDPPGLLFLGSAAAYGIGRLGLELLRADAPITALPTRMNLAFSAMLAVVSVAGFVLKLH